MYDHLWLLHLSDRLWQLNPLIPRPVFFSEYPWLIVETSASIYLNTFVSSSTCAQVTEIIYVHSKLLIVDDKITIIGSGEPTIIVFVRSI